MMPIEFTPALPLLYIINITATLRSYREYEKEVCLKFQFTEIQDCRNTLYLAEMIKACLRDKNFLTVRIVIVANFELCEHIVSKHKNKKHLGF